MIKEDVLKIAKLNDAYIEDEFVYFIFNIINKLSLVLPSCLFHMIYLKVKKNV